MLFLGLISAQSATLETVMFLQFNVSSPKDTFLMAKVDRNETQ